jgi:hypothetical protein
MRIDQLSERPRAREPSRTARRAVPRAAVVLCVAALSVAVAQAHVVKYPTGSLTIEYANVDAPDSTDSFSGKVSANKSACQANRRVEVLLDLPGVDLAVGSDRTTEDGSWKVLAENVPPGEYYAESDRKTLKLTVDHRHVCRIVVSDRIQAGP